MTRLLVVLAATFGCVSGCQSMAPNEEFEFLMNHQVGKPIANSRYRDPEEKKPLGDGKFEYIIRSKNNACVWAFIVDEKAGVIQSWHYISVPSVCRLHTSMPW